MNLNHWLCACLVAAGMAAWPAPARGTAPGLAQALELAWQRAVAARESQAQRERAAAERGSASRLWAAPPSLELGHRSDRWQRNTGQSELELGLAVPLWLPGQRGARQGAAEMTEAHAQAAERVARWRLAGELREVLAAIASSQAGLVQAQAETRALKALADDVQRRVGAGDLARTDALAAQAEALSAAAHEAEAGLRQRQALTRWTLLTGLQATPQTALPPAAPSAAPPDAQAAPSRAAGAVADAGPEPAAAHPELALARLATAWAQSRIELLRASRREAPELSIGLRREVPERGRAGAGSLFVGVRLPLATDDRNRPLEAAALGELEVARAHEQRLAERIDADVANARGAWRLAGLQLDTEAARARLLRERARLLERSFQAGESPLAELLRALAAATQAEAAMARQQAAWASAQANLDQALGRLP